MGDCIGCGYCCAKAPCHVGVASYGPVAPCPGLVFDDDRFWCRLVLDAEDRLHRREVEVIRVDREEVLIRAVDRGERICVSALDIFVEGMRVRAAVETAGPGVTESRS